MEDSEIKLVIAWMVENDEDMWHLSYKSVEKHADAMIVIDGNEDTYEHELSRYFTTDERVTIIPDPYPHSDRGADGKQRNKYLEYIKEHHPDAWVLVLDADEVVDHPEKIRPFIKQLIVNNCDAASPTMRHFVWNLACEDSTVEEHYVPLRLFKVKPELHYPEVEHNVLQGVTKYVHGSLPKLFFTIWHFGYAREMFTLRRKYFNHFKKSNMHTPEFLTWWYHAHLFGEFPTKPIPRHEIPEIIVEEFEINTDYIYFKDRGAELKHWEDAVHWKNFFKPHNALEVGCGFGHRVRALRNLGVGANGFDISMWAIKNTPYENELPKHALWQGNLLDEQLDKGGTLCEYDLVIAYDVLEHIEEKDLDTAIQNIRGWTNRWVLLSIPFEGDPNLYRDHTHRIFRPRDWWVEQLAKHGLAVVPTPEHFNFKHQLLILEKQEGAK